MPSHPEIIALLLHTPSSIVVLKMICPSVFYVSMFVYRGTVFLM